MLCSNDSKNLEQSISSLSELSIAKESEIVITDNLSKDGSQVLLRRLLKRGLISKVIERRCSRGMGRQLAFAGSSGDYVLCHLDCDDIFNPKGLDELVRQYHTMYEGFMAMTKKLKGGSSNITIAPRELLNRLGGWRDINWMEDWDLWERAATAGMYVNYPYPISNPPHTFVRVRWNERSTSLLQKAKARYGKYRDSYRIGRMPFAPDQQISSSEWLINAYAKMVVRIKRARLAPVANPYFKEIQFS